MDAIILAGGVPQPGESLYPFTRGISKAMLEIAGKPMVQWILDALSGAKSIENVVIVGLPLDTDLQFARKLAFIPAQSGFVDNIRAAAKKSAEITPGAKYVLLVSADIPAVTSAMIDRVVNSSQGQNLDIYYNVIPREVMERRFPGAHRTYLHLKGLEFCGGDTHVMSLRLLLEDDMEVWRTFTAARKSPLKQAALIGFDTIFLYLFRLLTIKLAETKLMKRLKVAGKVVICPDAEIGMDVDKPRHLEIMTSYLQKHP